MTAFYGLPLEVRFCKRCVISNQRPNSVVEFKNASSHRKPTINFDEEGVCLACRYADRKAREIDWKSREIELMRLCDRFRSKDGSYDCIAPGSGGKDSGAISHILKYKYGMNPLTVTWAPHKTTDIGLKNFHSWIDSGFDNILYTPNGKLHRLLTRLAFENLVHPFQPFIIGQKIVAPRVSALYGIPLIFYGENPAEYGDSTSDFNSPKMDPAFFTGEANLDQYRLSGLLLSDLIEKHGIDRRDLGPYLPVNADKLRKIGTEVHYASYYMKWDLQDNFYYAVENTGYEPNRERTQGTYSKYCSIDDVLDYLHFFTMHVKFGIGRATWDAAQEIRAGKITREEGVALVRRYDAEFPSNHFEVILEYLGISEERFWEVIDGARSPHLWQKSTSGWHLLHQVS